MASPVTLGVPNIGMTVRPYIDSHAKPALMRKLTMGAPTRWRDTK